MNATYPIKSYAYPIMLGLASLLFSSCEIDQNPLEVAYQDIQHIVMQAEKRSESMPLELDPKHATLSFKQDGLDALFLPASYQNQQVPLEPQSLRYLIQFEISTTDRESSAYETYLSQYETKQSAAIQLARELQQQTLDSFKHYKNSLEMRLNVGSLTQIQYDELLTKSKETFTTYLRHKYQESRIVTGSSYHLNDVLQQLQKTLSETSWERLSSRLKQE